jgi:hypothetical protein
MMTTEVKVKALTRLDVGQRTRIFLIIMVAVLAVASVLIFLVSAPAPSIASSASDPSAVDADTARWVAMGEFYAAQTQAEQGAMNAYAARLTGQAEQGAMSAYAARLTGQAEQDAMNYYEARNTARELRNADLAEYLGVQAPAELRSLEVDAARWEALAEYYSAQAPAESAYEAFLNARALRNANPTAHSGDSKGIGNPTLDASDRGCVYDNDNRVFICRS